MKRLASFLPWGAYSLSGAMHGWFLLAPPTWSTLPPAKLAPALVQFTVSPAKPPPQAEVVPQAPPPPAPEPVLDSPPPPPEPKLTDDSPIPPELSPAPPATQAAPPSVEAPPELTGTTLTAEGEGSWQAEVGSGRARQGAFVAGVSRVAPEAAPVPRALPRPAAAEKELAVEPLKDLLKRPAPPNLAGALLKNYPAEARAQGQSGEAKVRARVDADGLVRVVRVVSESTPGFGTACERTLKLSQWSAPLSRKGTPVATWISYRCSFVVDD